jgi:hypothetical protein
MPELLSDLRQLPVGSHCLDLYATREEATDAAVQFLAGAPPGQPTRYWVADSTLRSHYEERLRQVAPGQVGCVAVLDHEQVRPVDGRLRPAEEVAGFVADHPEGVTGGADTISRYWASPSVPAHLEYEAWFDAQPRDRSRFLCPYDLRTVPPEDAPRILRDLGRHHSHAVLSASSDPAVRLLQLFLFATPGDLPPALAPTYIWAIESGLIAAGEVDRELELSPAGFTVVTEWSERTRVDW